MIEINLHIEDKREMVLKQLKRAEEIKKLAQRDEAYLYLRDTHFTPIKFKVPKVIKSVGSWNLVKGILP